jgi:hypothetical protein
VKLVDVKVGMRFRCGENDWLVTDVGYRVVVAVRLTGPAQEDPTWLDGPPYALAEHVFDEHSLPVCEVLT